MPNHSMGLYTICEKCWSLHSNTIALKNFLGTKGLAYFVPSSDTLEKFYNTILGLENTR